MHIILQIASIFLIHHTDMKIETHQQYANIFTVVDLHTVHFILR